MNKTFKENAFVISILVGILLIAFYDICFFQKTFKNTTATSQALITGPFGQANNKPSYFAVQSTDSSQMEEPLYEFVKKSLRQGVFPLWNPHQGCGSPFISMMEVGIFFPLSFLLYFLPQLFAWDAMVFGRLFFAGFFTYGLMRTLGFSRIPSLGAALIFMLSGPMVVLQYWFTNVELLAPLLLLTLERLARSPSIKNSCLVALAVAATFFAGHPEHILFVNAFGILYFCFRALVLQTWRQWKKLVVLLPLACLLGMGLSAMTWMPFIYNSKTELWHSHTGNTALQEIPPEKKELFSILTPYFFQKELVKTDFSRVGCWWGGYIGVLPFILALIGLWRKQYQGLNYFLALLAFLNITKIYFKWPIFWVVEVLPFFRYCRFHPHTAHLLALTLAVMAGMGIHLILTEKKIFKKGLLCALVFLIFQASLLFYYRKADHFAQSLHVSLVGAGVLLGLLLLLWLKNTGRLRKKIIGVLVLAVVGLELCLYIPRERAKRFDSFPQVPYIEFVKNLPERIRVYGIYWTLTPNTATAYQLDDLGIFIAQPPKRLVTFINKLILQDLFKKDCNNGSLQVYPITFYADRQPFLDMLNVGFTIGPKNIAAYMHDFSNMSLEKPIVSPETLIFPHSSVLPRTFVVHRAIFEPDEDRMFGQIILIRNQFRQAVVIQGKDIPKITQELLHTPLTDDSKATINKYTANEVIIHARMSSPGLVVLSDAFHPDWQAFIDGERTQIYFTNGLIRSVFVPAGEHTIRYIFVPWSFYLGLWVSGISFLFLIGLLLQNKKRDNSKPSS